MYVCILSIPKITQIGKLWSLKSIFFKFKKTPKHPMYLLWKQMNVNESCCSFAKAMILFLFINKRRAWAEMKRFEKDECQWQISRLRQRQWTHYKLSVSLVGV